MCAENASNVHGINTISRSKNSQPKNRAVYRRLRLPAGGGFDAALAGGVEHAEAAVDVGRPGAVAVPGERDDDGRSGRIVAAPHRAEVKHEPAVAGGEAGDVRRV